MTVTDNDRIRLLIVIRKRMMFVCKIVIINGIVLCSTSAEYHALYG